MRKTILPIILKLPPEAWWINAYAFFVKMGEELPLSEIRFSMYVMVSSSLKLSAEILIVIEFARGRV